MKKNLFLLPCIAAFLVVAVFSACTRGSLHTSYARNQLEINDDSMRFDLRCDSTKYIIDRVIPLSVPERFLGLQCEKMEYVDGYFYLLDKEVNHSVLVFDSLGNFVASLGRRGHANNEYIEKPSDFFVDSKHNRVEVFERRSPRVHIFSRSGKQENFVKLKMWPYAIGITSENNIMAAFDNEEAGGGLQLGIFNHDEELVKPFFEIDCNHEFINDEMCFVRSGDYLYHIPNFSDSVLIFKSDSLVEVKKICFKSPFLTSDIKKKANVGDIEEYMRYEGINGIRNYYETPRYINLSYSKSMLNVNCIIDKRTGSQYQFLTVPFKGFFPAQAYTLSGSTSYWLITKEDVDMIMDLTINKSSSKKEQEKEWSVTPSVVKDLLCKKYGLPAIVQIRFKDETYTTTSRNESTRSITTCQCDL